jgi:hypothetical protein
MTTPERRTYSGDGFEIAVGRPIIVCLCGSTKFKKTFEEVNRDETAAGRIVLSVGVFHHADGIEQTEQQVAALMALHRHKIDLADEVLILNVGGYIGEHLKEEIAYAEKRGKPLRWLEDPPAKIP